MTTAIEKLDKDWAITSAGADIKDIVHDNLGGERMSLFNLPKISVPSQGVTQWSVPGLTGSENADSIDGVVLHSQLTRQWYEKTFEETGGGSPPDCYSSDGINGVGVNADKAQGLCAKCEFSAWGSDRRGGSGQDCGATRPLMILRRDDIVPIWVATPAGSLDAAKKWLFDLTRSRLRYWQVITRIGLEKVRQRNGGLEYSRMTFRVQAVLDAASQKKIQSLRDEFAPIFSQIDASESAK